MKLPTQKRPVSFMKGLVLFYLIFLAIFFAAAPFLTLLLYAETDLSRSLLPQLIGFCLQGTFLVVVFALYEKRTTINTKRSQKFTLRTFLSTFVNPLLPKSEQTNPQDFLLPSPANFSEGLDTLLNQGLNATTEANIRKVADRNLTSVESLSVVAAQIDHYHLEVWNAIIISLRKIRDTQNQQETTNSVIQLLENIRRFDELYIF